MALTDKLSAIAAAIRSKTGRTAPMTLSQMPSEILSIPTGSSDTPTRFGGLNATLVAQHHETFTVSDTTFVPGTTSSTSATTLKVSVANYYTSPSIAIGDKDIIVVQHIDVVPTHQASATKKALYQKGSFVGVSWISKRRTTSSSTKNTRQVVNTTSSSNLRYYNASGTDSVSNTTYGFYATPQTASVASTTAASTTVRINSPTLSCRASTTYESSANMLLVTDFAYEWYVDIYLADAQSSVASAILDQAYGFMFS